MNPSVALQEFINTHLATVEPLSRETALANWEMQTTSSDAVREKVTDLNTRFARIYADPDDYAFLKSLDAEAIDSPTLARQHLLLLNAYLENQIPAELMEKTIALTVEIEDSFNIFRGVIDGETISDNAIEKILDESRDVTLRKQAWEASKQVGQEVSERVLELVRMRNQAATTLGYENYYVMSLQMQELTEERLFQQLDDLAEKSEDLWNAFRDELDEHLALRFNTTPDAIRPWHHHNRFFQSPEPGNANLDRFFADKDLESVAADFFRAIGLPIEELLAKADLYEREGKCQHAFCMDVDRKGDVRVLCNLQSNERWASTLLHEYGHAVYDKYTDHSLPYLLRTPAHIMTTEAIALFMGRLTKSADWLNIYAGVDKAEAERITVDALQEVRNQLLVFMRWCLVMSYFEREMYRNPEQDLNTVWWDIVERFQRVKRPDGRNTPDWASKIHLATAPTYYHNYQLGEMIASQLLNYLHKAVLNGEPSSALVTSPKVGAWLTEKVFYPGALYPWEEWLEFATGEPLNPAYFVADLGER